MLSLSQLLQDCPHRALHVGSIVAEIARKLSLLTEALHVKHDAKKVHFFVSEFYLFIISLHSRPTLADTEQPRRVLSRWSQSPELDRSRGVVRGYKGSRP